MQISFFSKWCIAFGHECMVLNPGVFFYSVMFQVMFKMFCIKISSDMEKPTKEYVASLTGLYKNNGAVLCVYHLILTWSGHFTMPELTWFLSDLHEMKNNN